MLVRICCTRSVPSTAKSNRPLHLTSSVTSAFAFSLYVTLTATSTIRGSHAARIYGPELKTRSPLARKGPLYGGPCLPHTIL